MTTKTISTREYNNLIKKSKTGWGKYYGEVNRAHEEQITLNYKLEQLQKSLQESQGTSFPVFLEKEINEIFQSVKKSVQCPICLDTLEDFKIASCGHKYCESCLAKIDKCGICRKKLWKSQ